MPLKLFFLAFGMFFFASPAAAYFTTEDIVLDLIMPAVDQRVIEEYKGEPLIDWHWGKIAGITYNADHSYDVAVKIKIPSEHDLEDLVKVRISPSCDSDRLNKWTCNHDFGIKILEYNRISD